MALYLCGGYVADVLRCQLFEQGGLPSVVQTQQQDPNLLVWGALQLTQDGQQSLQQAPTRGSSSGVFGDRGQSSGVPTRAFTTYTLFANGTITHVTADRVVGHEAGFLERWAQP